MNGSSLFRASLGVVPHRSLPRIPPTIMAISHPPIGCRGELEQFAAKSPHGLLVLEDVDEDAESADATFLDELIMLARDSPIWKEELRRYLQRGSRERRDAEGAW